MHHWLRRIRGAFAIGIIWGTAWAAVGIVPRWVLGYNPDAPFPLVFGVLGFIAGVTFSGLLALTDRRRGFDQLSLPRVAGWGALGGLLVSSIFAKLASLDSSALLALAPTFAILCAVCASGSLALARRATQRELSEPHPEAAKAELIDHKSRQLR